MGCSTLKNRVEQRWSKVECKIRLSTAPLHPPLGSGGAVKLHGDRWRGGGGAKVERPALEPAGSRGTEHRTDRCG